jgi:replication fork protection complex subunit Tof1/Swi1
VWTAAFFASILSDIRMERLKVKESDTIRFLFLSRFFLEFFLLVRLDEAKNGPRGVGQTELRGFELIAEVTEVAFIGFVTSRMKKSLEEKVSPSSSNLRGEN